MYLKALQIAFNAHKGQTRRDSDVPYIVHPIRVSSHFDGNTLKAIAVLHDVIEDTDITFEDIKNQFPREISIPVILLTRHKDEQYSEYIEMILQDENAIKVKIADIIDNLSDNPKPSMIPRYIKALDILLNKKT